MTTPATNSFKLDSKVIGRLLDLLATDDSFREIFKQSPYSALLQAGYETGESDALLQQMSKCLVVENLASKELMQSARAALEAQLSAGLTMSPIQLNVADHKKRTTKTEGCAS